MTVVSCNEIWSGRDGDWATSKTGTVRRYSRVWRVVTNDRHDDAVAVAAACPAIGTAFPNDANSWLRSIKPNNQSFSPYVWIVVGAYSSEYEVKESPLDEPAKISWRTQNFRRPYAKDRDGKAILNSAGDPFDPPVDGDDSRWQCTIRKNVAAVPAIVTTYRDAINSGSFTVQGMTIGAKTAKIMSIEVSDWQRAPDDSIYYVFTWSFAINPDTWDHEQLDAGMRMLDQIKGGLVRITGLDGQAVHSPVPLDGNGWPIMEPTPDTAVFITTKLYPLKDFSSLPVA